MGCKSVLQQVQYMGPISKKKQTNKQTNKAKQNKTEGWAVGTCIGLMCMKLLYCYMQLSIIEDQAINHLL